MVCLMTRHQSKHETEVEVRFTMPGRPNYIAICKHLLKLVAEQQLWYKTTTSVLEKKSFTFRKD